MIVTTIREWLESEGKEIRCNYDAIMFYRAMCSELDISSEGIVFDIRNTLLRVLAIITLKRYHQNSLGRILDALWLVSILVFISDYFY